MNRRRDNRITKVLKAKITCEGKCGWGVVQDVSLHGLYFKTNIPLSKGKMVTLELCLPPEEQSCAEGLAMRIEMLSEGNWKFGVGMLLTRNDKHYQNYVCELNEHAKKMHKVTIEQVRSNEFAENNAIREAP